MRAQAGVMPVAGRHATRGRAARIDGKEVGRVLITGASSGIGTELARVFARNGFRLTLVARGRQALERLAQELGDAHGADVKIVARDLAQPDGPAAVARAARAGGEVVSVLVNNAGVTDFTPMARARTAALLGMVDLNVRALTELTSRLLPDMVERGVGRILNVASLAAFQPVPQAAAYGASKAYVLSLSEALSEELRGTGVRVTALCPGFTETPMADQIRQSRALPRQLMSDPAEVAAEGYRGLMAGRVVVVPGWSNQLVATWAQTTPRWITRTLSGMAARASSRAP